MDRVNTNKGQSRLGHLFLVSTLLTTLVLPITLIILSYLKIIDGISLGMILTAIAVILSSVYIFYGTILMALQDKKDKDSGHL